ncbi:MAG: hypothetical protein L3J17_13715 [Candidatus Jettenia sp.]|nr:MAG: hypothetical protein L3J17_13715 [Candidatus Jettenia sp.]
MVDSKIDHLFAFISETIDYFLSRLEGVDRGFTLLIETEGTFLIRASTTLSSVL